MICYGIAKLREAGMRDIVIVTGRSAIAGFAEVLGSGQEWGVSLVYRIQENPGGIAQALKLAKPFIGPGEKFAVLLADNLFEAIDRIRPRAEGNWRLQMSTTNMRSAGVCAMRRSKAVDRCGNVRFSGNGGDTAARAASDMKSNAPVREVANVACVLLAAAAVGHGLAWVSVGPFRIAEKEATSYRESQERKSYLLSARL